MKIESKTVKFGIRGAILGFVIALALAGLAYFLNWRQITYHLDTLYMVLAPTSLFLMLTDHATLGGQIVVVLIIALQNAFIYLVLGLITGALWSWISPTNSSLKIAESVPGEIKEVS
jgi:cellobiose-specific phosphotransferase system component IIC